MCGHDARSQLQMMQPMQTGAVRLRGDQAHMLPYTAFQAQLNLSMARVIMTADQLPKYGDSTDVRHVTLKAWSAYLLQGVSQAQARVQPKRNPGHSAAEAVQVQGWSAAAGQLKLIANL